MTAAPIAQTSPIDIVLARVLDAREVGTSTWVARCPGHEDAEEHLGIKLGRDGRVVLTCSAGCKPSVIAHAIGMELSDLFPPSGSSISKPDPVVISRENHAPVPKHERRPPFSEDAEQAVLAAMLIDADAAMHAFELVDDDMFYAPRHRLLFKAMRYLTIAGTTIDPLTLSNRLDSLGELKNAGGKDYIGFLVDAVPTSANIEYHAKIVRDKAQLRRLIQVGQSLENEAFRGTLSAQDLARHVSTMLQPITEGNESESLPAPIPAFDLPDDEPITWIVEDLLVAGEVGVFAGDGGSYKSTVGLHFAAAIAGGYNAFSRFATTRRATLILSAEDGRGVIKNRLHAICEGHLWDKARCLANVHVLATHEAKLSDTAWQAHLLELCDRLNIGFCFFDPLADLIDGDENSNSDLRPVIRLARRIAKLRDASVIFNHHATKVRENQRTIDRVRGASALRDAARSVLFFESKPEGIGVEHLKMSRAPKLAPFTLTREIDSEADNHAMWTSARFIYQSAGEAVVSRAESVILDHIVAAPGQLKSGDLRDIGVAAGIRGEDVSRAVSQLQARGLIEFVEGKRKARLWHPVDRTNLPDPTLPNDLGRVKNDPAHPAPSRSGRVEAPHSDPAHPARPFRDGRQGGGSGRGRIDAANEALELGDVPEEYDS